MNSDSSDDQSDEIRKDNRENNSLPPSQMSQSPQSSPSIRGSPRRMFYQHVGINITDSPLLNTNNANQNDDDDEKMEYTGDCINEFQVKINSNSTFWEVNV